MSTELGAPVPACDVPASDASPARRFRGKNKSKRWTRGKDTELAVIRLPLDVHDPTTRHRTEDLYSAMWSVKRALQRDARDAIDAYWAGDVRRATDAQAWRLELGLSREGMERRAYRHMENSRHLAHHVTKALVMHQADEVFETSASRHLFADSSGRRFGRPKVGRWWDYTRIPGRARSHTAERKWETFRLHGTPAGHLEAYRHRGLDRTVTTPEQAAPLPPDVRVLEQPRQLPTPVRPTGRVETGEVTPKGTPKKRAATWWDHTGPLAVVFTGGADSSRGDLVLPVRLPSGSGRWPYLLHFLNNPETWHKIDLVRRRDTSAPGGWAYEAHLMGLCGSYASPATKARRQAAAALERRGGADGNVSNLSIVSFPATFDPADGDVEATRIEPSDEELAALAKTRQKERGRKRGTRPLSPSGQPQPVPAVETPAGPGRTAPDRRPARTGRRHAPRCEVGKQGRGAEAGVPARPPVGGLPPQPGTARRSRRNRGRRQRPPRQVDSRRHHRRPRRQPRRGGLRHPHLVPPVGQSPARPQRPAGS